MPLVNHSQQELHVKVVYYGPGLGGKTTNLEYIHAQSDPGRRGKLISLVTESERTLFFDLLPLQLGKLRDYTVRLHLCTVPGQIAHDETRRLVLRHVDGVVFVVDSQKGREEANAESIKNLSENLKRQGDDPDRLPLVVQYNKRDLDNLHDPEHLKMLLGVPDEVIQVEASALEGWGVFETLKQITKSILKLIGNPELLPAGRSPSILPGSRASMYRAAESGELPALNISMPKAPRVPGELSSEFGIPKDVLEDE